EEPGRQKHRNAHRPVERMIYETGAIASAARGAGDTKSAVCDRKQTFSDKKMAFRDQARRVRWAWSARQRTLPFSGASNDSPPPARRRHRYRFRRSRRLLGHDCSEERLPGYEWFFNLRSSVVTGPRKI